MLSYPNRNHLIGSWIKWIEGAERSDQKLKSFQKLLYQRMTFRRSFFSENIELVKEEDVSRRLRSHAKQHVDGVSSSLKSCCKSICY